MEVSIKLQRPLAVLDLETTGLRPDQDRIVEIAILRVLPDGSTSQYLKRINPLMPIPPEATAVHGIRDEDVQRELPFKAVAQEVADFLNGCDLAGFNLTGYDLKMLQREFDRTTVQFACSDRAIVDAKQIYHAKEPRTLEAACRFYLNEEHENAHSALDDVLATWKVLNAQLIRYEDLPRDPAALNSLFNRTVDPDGKFEWNGQNAAFTFGKYRGRLLQDIAEKDAEYLVWIADKGEFSQNTKQIARNALKGEFPKRGKAAAPTN
jgi:DNA polymerase-3 subunit epsilon